MPCWTINTATLDMGKMDVNSLFSVLQDLGLRPVMQDNAIYFSRGTYNRKTGSMELRGITNTEAWMKDVKQRVASKNTETQARKMGWQIKRMSPTQIQLMKR